jgi:hypothetical protein
MKYSVKEIRTDLFAIAAGVAISICVGVVLLFFSVIVTNGDEGFGARTIFILIGIGIPAFSGGFVSGSYSRMKNYTNVIVTVLLFILFLWSNNDFMILPPLSWTLFIFGSAILFALFGGWVAFKTKKLPA